MHRPAVASPFAAEYLAFFRVIFFQGAVSRFRPYSASVPIDGKTKNYEYAKIKAVYSNNYKLKTTFDAPALQNAGHDGCFRMGQTA